MIELGPKTVLKGLVKKIKPDVNVLNIEDIKSLEKTLQYLETLKGATVNA